MFKLGEPVGSPLLHVTIVYEYISSHISNVIRKMMANLNISRCEVLKQSV